MSSISVTKRVLQNQVVDIPNGDLHELELRDDYDRIQFALSVAKDINGNEVFSVSSSTNQLILVNADGTPVEPGTPTDPGTGEGDGGDTETPPAIVEYQANSVILPTDTKVRYLTADILKTNEETNDVDTLGTIDIDLGVEGSITDLLNEIATQTASLGINEPLFKFDTDGVLSGVFSSINRTTSDTYTGLLDSTGSLTDWFPEGAADEYSYGTYMIEVKDSTTAAGDALDFKTILSTTDLTPLLLRTGLAAINTPVTVPDEGSATFYEGTLYQADPSASFKTAALDIVKEDSEGDTLIGSVSVNLDSAGSIEDIMAAITADIESQLLDRPLFINPTINSVSGVDVTVASDQTVTSVTFTDDGSTVDWVEPDASRTYNDAQYKFVFKATEVEGADTALDTFTILTAAGVSEVSLFTGKAMLAE